MILWSHEELLALLSFQTLYQVSHAQTLLSLSWPGCVALGYRTGATGVPPLEWTLGVPLRTSFWVINPNRNAPFKTLIASER